MRRTEALPGAEEARDRGPATGPSPVDAPAAAASGSSLVLQPIRRGDAPWQVKVVAGLTALGGVLAVLVSLRPFATRVEGLNHVVNPLDYRVGAQVLSLVTGAALLYLAGNLTRRKRAAWAVALAIFGSSVVLQLGHLTQGGLANAHASPLQLGYAAGMVVLLLLSRRQFRVAADPPSLFQVFTFVPIYLAVVFAYGFAALALERNHLSPALNASDSFFTIAESLLGIDGEYTYQRRPFAVLFPASLAVLGVVFVGVVLYLVFRPIVAQARTHADWEHANRLVHEHGTDTLAYFALRHDKSYFFSSDGEAMVAYAYLGHHALVSGDPIGAAGSIDLVIDEFLAMCAHHGWGAAFLAVREAEADRYLQRGLHTFYLGDEAVIDCESFTLEGKRNKSMRQSVGRVARTHTFTMLPESEAGPELVAQLNAISARWRGKAPERGFTMALSQDVRGQASEQVLCIARDELGVPHGFLRIVPVFGDVPGYTLDMMRRDPDSPNGMTEYLVANTVFALRELGLRRFSMNFAVMGRLFAEDLPFTRRQRLLRAVVSLLNPFFQIKSLHDFNRRFRPRWEPRMIVYEDQRSLPQVALLYSGVEGFLALPVIGRFFVPRRFDRDHPSVGARRGAPDPGPPRGTT